MKKITFIALHLGYGGIERCIVSLANALVEKYDVEIVSIYKLYDKPGFSINKKVKITYLLKTDLALRVSNYKELLFSLKLGSLIKYLFNDYLKKGKFITLIKDTYKGLKLMIKDRKLVLKKFLLNDKSDIYISTRILTNKLVSEYANEKSLKIAWEHNHHHGNTKYANEVIKSVEKMDYLILVSKDLNKFYKDKVKCKSLYIPNTIDSISNKPSKLNNKRLISVGRLSKEKGYMDLLKVFKILYKNDDEYTLDIIGAGNELDDLKNYIKENNLENNVNLHGFQNKKYINNLLEKSSLYLMASYTESFGIVLIEAMSTGLPCIAFSSAEGACEIVKDDYNGYLIDNRNKVIMARRIEELINDQKKLNRLGKNAIKTASNYTMDKIKDNWINIIEKK